MVLGRLKQNGSNPFEVTLNVTNITQSTLNGSNVAVLHLATQPTLSNYIQPICLDNGRTIAVGTTCWAAGWSSGRGGGESTGVLPLCITSPLQIQHLGHCTLFAFSLFYVSFSFFFYFSNFRGTSSAGVPDLGGRLWEHVNE